MSVRLIIRPLGLDDTYLFQAMTWVNGVEVVHWGQTQEEAVSMCVLDLQEYYEGLDRADINVAAAA